MQNWARWGRGLFILFHLCAAALWAARIEYYIPRLSPDGVVGYYRGYVNSLTRRMATETVEDFTYEQLVDQSWAFLDDPYLELFSEPKMAAKLREADPEMTPQKYIAALKAADRKLDPRHIIFLRAVDPISGKTEGWMRLVTNSRDLALVGGDEHSPLPGILPVVGKYPGVGQYLDSVFEYQVEVGRMATAKELGRLRMGTLADMFISAISLFGLHTPYKRIAMVAESTETTIEIYEYFQLQRDAFTLAPGFTLMTGRAFDIGRGLLLDFHDAIRMPDGLEYFRPSLDKKLQNLDAYLLNLPHSLRLTHAGEFEKMRTLCELGRYEEACTLGRRMRVRTGNWPELRSTLLEAETLRRYDPVRKVGNLEVALAYLDEAATQIEYGDVPGLEPTTTEHFTYREYLKLWLMIEGGDRYRKEIRRMLGEYEGRRLRQFIYGDGKRYHVVSPLETYGHNRVRTWKEFLYDPEAEVGLPGIALDTVNAMLPVYPFALSYSAHEYRARLLEVAGREFEAREVREKAKVLLINRHVRRVCGMIVEANGTP
jgi:hypothetical protein